MHSPSVVAIAATSTSYQILQSRLAAGKFSIGLGVAAFLSGLMVAYYLWNLATGPVPHAKGTSRGSSKDKAH